MKNYLSKSNLIVLYILLIVFSSTIVLASNAVPEANSIPFEYNILATVSEGTTIDTTAQSKLKFNLIEPMDQIYYNGNLVDIEDNSFEIDISGLYGETIFSFTDINNKIVHFKYFLSNNDGLLENYELVQGKKLNSYIKTHNSIRIIYTDREANSLSLLIEYLDSIPEKLLSNISSIKMVPFDNTSNIAGVTKDNMITLYNFSKYKKYTQENIIYHEIAHTFANKLIVDNLIDYSLSEYKEIIKLDNNYVSHYAKKSLDSNGRPSEDFADSIAFYFINSNFSKFYPNRYKYISNLISL